MNSLEVWQSLFPQLPRATLVVLLVYLIGAAIFDVRYRRIPNWLNLTGVLLGFGINTVIGAPGYGFLFALLGFAVGLFSFMAFYVMRYTRAGDVKMMAALGALVGWKAWVGLFLVTAIVGGIMALLLVAMRGRLQRTLWNVGFMVSEMAKARPAYVSREELDVRSPKSLRLPRGAVVAISALFFLAISARLPR
jgi:prepilin peptidase CpaA